MHRPYEDYRHLSRSQKYRRKKNVIQGCYTRTIHEPEFIDENTSITGTNDRAKLPVINVPAELPVTIDSTSSDESTIHEPEFIDENTSSITNDRAKLVNITEYTQADNILENNELQVMYDSRSPLTKILANWAATEVSVPHASVNRLLSSLQCIDTQLPLDHKTLLKKRKIPVETMDPGEFVYFPDWIVCLKQRLIKNFKKDTSFNLIINIDGCSLFKVSPDYKIYPILLTVYGVANMTPICPQVFIAQIKRRTENHLHQTFF